MIFKPHFWSFMISRCLLLSIFAWIFASIIVLLIFSEPLIRWWVLIPYIILITFCYYALYVSYKKEYYSFEGNKIIRHYGTIFSDNSLELQLHRTAIISLVRPFLLDIFFATGHVVVSAAGSGNASFVLQHMKHPKEIYADIESRLQTAGFHMERSKMIQEARPHWLGIFWEVGQKILVTFFILAYAFWSIAVETIENTDFIWMWFLMHIAIWGIILFILVGYVLLSYLDLRNRRYTIYEDAVEFYEWFLTKRYGLIPMENVSDVENTQSFFSKIFWLHDIKVSCVGSGNDVVFKNMTYGETMIAHLKHLKDAIIPRQRSKDVSVSTQSLVSYVDKIEEIFTYDQAFTASYKMSLKRSLLPCLIFLIPPITPFGIVILIGQFIRVKFTDYEVAGSSIEKRFHFLTNKHASYSIEKIMGIVFRRNLLDLFFGTCSVKFLSLGSSENLTFSNVIYSEQFEQRLQEKVGVYSSVKREKIPIRFSFMNYMKANILWSWILVLSLPIYMYKVFFYSQKYYKNSGFDGGIVSQRGIFIRTKSYALARNIKGVISLKYPWTQVGRLQFNVAGEKIVQTQQASAGVSTLLLSNMISIPYVHTVQDAQIYFDRKFFWPDFNTELVRSTKQSLKNAMFPLICVLGIFSIWSYIFGIGIGLAVTIVSLLILWWTLWMIRVRFFHLEKSRVVFGSGIIYKRRQSILYTKFNFIELNRGFLNKMFQNGSIGIYTLGSSQREMTLRDMDSYSEYYELLQTQ